jgi:glycosyltransferase involved in cell wall biosynthesis
MPEKAPVHWCFITPEYPPTVGGVADYTRLVATHLVQAGQQVTVLAPSRGEPPRDEGLAVEPVLGEFGPIGFWRGSQVLDSLPRTRRLFLQWVPHGFGFKSMNLFVVLWIWWRVVIRRDQLWIMVHEPFLRFEKNWKQMAAAIVHRLMIAILLCISSKVFAGNRLWLKLISFWSPKGLKVCWAPVPSGISEYQVGPKSEILRKKYADNKKLVGHFGTFGLQTTFLLEKAVCSIMKKTNDVNFIVFGRNSDNFQIQFVKAHSCHGNRVFSSGQMTSEDVSALIKSCDVMVQVFSEGLSARNSSLMAALSHGACVVGTSGVVTDPEWESWGGVELFGVDQIDALSNKVCELLQSQEKRRVLSCKARELYRKVFSIENTLKVFLSDTPSSLYSDSVH